MAYRRKTTSTRRRTYRKKPVSTAVKRYVKAKVRTTTQVKEYRTGGTYMLNTVTPSIVGTSALSYIVKGDEIQQREANAVYLRSLHLTYTIENTNVTQSRGLRLLVVKEQIPNTTISVTGMFTDNNFADYNANGLISSLAYPINTKLFQVLYDRRINVPPQSSSVQSIKTGQIKIPIRKRVVFWPTSASTTDTITGHIHFLVLLGDTTVTANNVEFNFMARVFFNDCKGFRPGR